MRILESFGIAFVVSFLIGKWMIPMLRRKKMGQHIKEEVSLMEGQGEKEGTPTMGGLMFIGGILIATLIAGGLDLASGRLGAVFVMAFALVFGVIGFLDDLMKFRHKENEGLTAGQKFALQVAAAIVFVVALRYFGYLSPSLYIPFLNVTVELNWAVYMVFAVFVIVGCVNSVNLTDGVDGLASGVTLPVALVFTAISVAWGYRELGVFTAAMFGGLCAFLIFNFHPAKVFMGDTGSLFLGGAVCGVAFALDVPLILILVGVIYIVETLSDIVQVTYFKLTHGKRILKMAPLHHHFQLCGWSEVKLFFVFTAISALFCGLAYCGVLNRYPM